MIITTIFLTIASFVVETLPQYYTTNIVAFSNIELVSKVSVPCVLAVVTAA